MGSGRSGPADRAQSVGSAHGAGTPSRIPHEAGTGWSVGVRASHDGAHPLAGDPDGGLSRPRRRDHGRAGHPPVHADLRARPRRAGPRQGRAGPEGQARWHRCGPGGRCRGARPVRSGRPDHHRDRGPRAGPAGVGGSAHRRRGARAAGQEPDPAGDAPGAGEHRRERQARRRHREREDQALTNTEKSPEELRAELAAKRARLGDTVEELAHRVDVPAQVKAKKDDTVAKLQEAKAQAARRVHEGTEKVKAAIAEKAPVVQHKVDEAVTKGKAVYAEKAPPAVQQRVDQAVEKGKAVYAEKAPVVQQHVNKAVADARPVVQEKVAQGHALLAEKAPPVERTLREKPGLVAGIAVALVVLLIATSRKRKRA